MSEFVNAEFKRNSFAIQLQHMSPEQILVCSGQDNTVYCCDTEARHNNCSGCPAIPLVEGALTLEPMGSIGNLKVVKKDN